MGAQLRRLTWAASTVLTALGAAAGGIWLR